MWPEFSIWHLLGAIFHYQRCYFQSSLVKKNHLNFSKKSIHENERIKKFLEKLDERRCKEFANMRNLFWLFSIIQYFDDSDLLSIFAIYTTYRPTEINYGTLTNIWMYRELNIECCNAAMFHNWKETLNFRKYFRIARESRT